MVNYLNYHGQIIDYSCKLHKYHCKLIKTTWEENDNGLDSMLQFKDICKAHTKNIPLKRYLGIKEIIDYNRIDCQVLYEIVELLRDKYKR